MNFPVLRRRNLHARPYKHKFPDLVPGCEWYLGTNKISLNVLGPAAKRLVVSTVFRVRGRRGVGMFTFHLHSYVQTLARAVLLPGLRHDSDSKTTSVSTYPIPFSLETGKL